MDQRFNGDVVQLQGGDLVVKALPTWSIQDNYIPYEGSHIALVIDGGTDSGLEEVHLGQGDCDVANMVTDAYPVDTTTHSTVFFLLPDWASGFQKDQFAVCYSPLSFGAGPLVAPLVVQKLPQATSQNVQAEGNKVQYTLDDSDGTTASLHLSNSSSCDNISAGPVAFSNADLTDLLELPEAGSYTVCLDPVSDGVDYLALNSITVQALPSAWASYNDLPLWSGNVVSLQLTGGQTTLTTQRLHLGQAEGSARRLLGDDACLLANANSAVVEFEPSNLRLTEAFTLPASGTYPLCYNPDGVNDDAVRLAETMSVAALPI